MNGKPTESHGVVERDGQLVFVPAPPARLERIALVVLAIAAPIVAVSSVMDAVNGESVLLSVATAAFIVIGAVGWVRQIVRRKRDPHAADPTPLPDDLIEQVRGLNAMRGNAEAIRLIRDRTGLGLGDAVTVSTWTQRNPAGG